MDLNEILKFVKSAKSAKDQWDKNKDQIKGGVRKQIEQAKQEEAIAQATKSSPVVVLIITAASYALFWYFGLGNIVDGISSFTWPSTKGKVTNVYKNSEFKKRTKDSKIYNGSKKKTLFSKRSGPKSFYKMTIKYSYAVNDKNYIGQNFRIGEYTEEFDDSIDLKNYQDYYNFKKNSSVDVFYNPKNPENAVLMKGLAFSQVTLFLITLGLSVLMTFLSIGQFKQQPTRISSTGSRKKTRKKKVGGVSSPWEHDWVIVGKTKKFGPYSHEKILSLLDRGKISERNKCYSTTDKKVIRIHEIVKKKAS